MNKIVLATRNSGKIMEISTLLQDLHLEMCSVKAFPDIAEIQENGSTFQENSLLKARSVFETTHLPALADDSGLEVFALGKKPGVFSARYAGEHATYDDNNKKLLSELQGVPAEKRQAQFRCVATFIADGVVKVAEGICSGRIIAAPRGTGGFGYDPIFVPDGYDNTFAELPAAVKNRLSHRARALQTMKLFLRQYFSL